MEGYTNPSSLFDDLGGIPTPLFREAFIGGSFSIKGWIPSNWIVPIKFKAFWTVTSVGLKAKVSELIVSNL